ncbi:MAG: tetraacyldisaccharide 4'-kinase [Candidatus Korobacteraceae bacterium]
MNPLSAWFGVGVAVRNRLYDRGTLRTHRLQAPVVSVGSISTGGAGKTPFLITLGELLKQRGIAFNVLSRGYGRRTKGVALVDPTGSPQEFGDEPLLIARKLGVPVIVGEDRHAAGQFAEEKFGLQAHLLDDGFQHRRLARDFDIALITQRDLHDTLLPSGRLREPLSSLARASAIVLMDDIAAEEIPMRDGQRAWRVSRSIVPPETREPCFAFCGTARPENFYTDLGKAGIRVVGTRSFRDHHAYSATDVESLFKLGQEAGATAFITTEKDAVNLDEHGDRLRPLHVTAVRMDFEPSTGPDADSPAELISAVVQRRGESPVRE